MPHPGSVWTNPTWDANAWAAGTWADVGGAAPAQSPTPTRHRRGYRVNWAHVLLWIIGG